MLSTLLFVGLVVACYGILFATAWRGREALLISLAFFCTMSFLFATKIVNVAGYPLVPSAPFMAVIFYSSTILQEFFGAREARKVLVINLGCMLGFTGLGFLVYLMAAYAPLAPAQQSLGEAFDTIQAFYPQALGAALLAFSTAYALNFALTKALHAIFGTRFFPLRSFLTVAIANLWDITAFVLLAYYPWSEATVGTILTTWLMRLACVAVGVPVLWQLKAHYRRLSAVEAD